MQYLQYLKYVLPGIAIAVIVAQMFLGRRPWHFARGALAAILLCVAALSAFSYVQGNRHSGLWLNGYEFFHYYLGGKYAREVGYTNLYNAVVVADAEDGVRRMAPIIRDLDSGRMVQTGQVLKDKDRYRSLFTEQRWTDFRRDVAFFRARVSSSLWHRMLQDKGYNATPLWTMLGATLSNTVSTESRGGMQTLVFADVVLLAAAFFCTLWAFGYRAALLLVVFMGTHYLMSHNTLRAAFLRLDWLACLVIAICMVKRERYKAAGAFTAWAALSRVFPAVFAFGIVARLLTDLLWKRTINRRCLAFLVSLGATSVILVGLSVLHSGGLGPWREFLDKVGQHDGDISPWRIGFKYVFLMIHDPYYQGNPQVFFESHQALWWSIQAGVLIVCALLIRGLDDAEAMAFGFVPAFFFFAPTYYYYVMLMAPLLFLAGHIERPLWAAGLLYVYVTGIVGHQLYALWDRTAKLFFVMSCMMGALALYMVFLALLELWVRKAGNAIEDTQLQSTVASQ